LPLPVYLIATPDEQLVRALRAVGKQPTIELCRWSDAVSSRREPSPDPPAPARPLVCCLFGWFGDPKSLILTEDDYFEFLARFASDREYLPLDVRAALARGGKWFLGFRPDEWSFRVLFHTLFPVESFGARSEEYLSLAVIPDPEERQTRDPAKTRRYVERQLKYGFRDMSVYWGTTEEFVREFRQRWAERKRGTP
jgi:hypothetical protein